MRIRIFGEPVEVRIQERRVIAVDFIRKGEVIAGGIAICSPKDQFDLQEGQKIAVERAAGQLEDFQTMGRKEMSRNVEAGWKAGRSPSWCFNLLPNVRPADEITEEILGKLDAQREKIRRALTRRFAARLGIFTGRLSSSKPNLQSPPSR